MRAFGGQQLTSFKFTILNHINFTSLDGTFKTYVDGELKGDYQQMTRKVLPLNQVNTHNLVFSAGFADVNNPGHGCNCRMDQLYIIEKELTAGEIQHLLT